MCNKIIVLGLIGILIAISNITLAQEKLQEIKAPDKFLSTSEKQMPDKKEIEESKILHCENNLPNPEIEFVNGIKYANSGEYDKAIEIFKTIITKYPNTKVANDAQYMIDKIQQEQRRQQEKFISKTTQPTKIEIPKEYYPDYQFNLGLEYYQERNFKEALPCFQNVVNTASEGSKLKEEAKEAIERIKKRLEPQTTTPPPQEEKVFKSTKSKEEKEKEWYEKIVQWQQGLLDEAMRLKNEGKLQEALKVLERVTDSRSSPVGEEATKEMVKIQEELGLLEQINEPPKNIEPGFRKLSDDELPEF